ncbi:hypothetical protein PR048_005654 [Dryococelus australis]|uniref:Uncharacterized protein n=1 Tax=Dryococelus australis TaxID=614101 RepID=A0ABQ9I8Y6_9NEOP|nr:hypothetical protein PR048_005654 [Dryococelus australis]
MEDAEIRSLQEKQQIPLQPSEDESSTLTGDSNGTKGKGWKYLITLGGCCCCRVLVVENNPTARDLYSITLDITRCGFVDSISARRLLGGRTGDAASEGGQGAVSLPTKANQVRFPAVLLPDISCRNMPLIGGFSQGSPVFPALAFRRSSILYSPHSEPTSCTEECLLLAPPVRVIEVNVEQRRNEGVAETGDPRENPPTNPTRFPLAKIRGKSRTEALDSTVAPCSRPIRIGYIYKGRSVNHVIRRHYQGSREITITAPVAITVDMAASQTPRQGAELLSYTETEMIADTECASKLPRCWASCKTAVPGSNLVYRLFTRTLSLDCQPSTAMNDNRSIQEVSPTIQEECQVKHEPW